MKKIITILLLLFAFSITGYAQGEIFTKEVAKVRFGEVKSKIRFNSQKLKAFTKSNKHLMFGLNKAYTRVNIMAKKNSPIFREFEDDTETLYHVYDSAKIEALIDLGGEGDTYIEQREDVLSLSNGIYILELALMCPPCCPKCPEWPDWPD